MSLESQIAELNTNIKALIAVMTTAPVETAPVETAPVETAPVETAPVETAPAETAPAETAPAETPWEPNHADLKAQCLLVARAGKKDQVKAVLKSYGAVKALDVPLHEIAGVITKLGKL